MLLLCLSLIWNRYWTTEYPAKLSTKLEILVSQLLPNSCLYTSLKLEHLDFYFKKLTVLVFSTNYISPLSWSKGITAYVLSQIFMFYFLQICFTILISCIAICSCLKSSPDFIIKDLIRYELFTDSNSFQSKIEAEPNSIFLLKLIYSVFLLIFHQ